MISRELEDEKAEVVGKLLLLSKYLLKLAYNFDLQLFVSKSNIQFEPESEQKFISIDIQIVPESQKISNLI